MRSLLGRFHRPMSRGLVNNMLTMNNLGDGSTLDLDFTTMGGVLDPRLTFSRASTATFVNSSGYVEWAGSNMVINSAFGGTSPGTGWTTNGAGSMSSSGGVFTASTTTSTTAFLSRDLNVSNGLRYSASINVTSVTGTINYNEVLTVGGTLSNTKFYRNGAEVGAAGNGSAQAQTGLITIVWTSGGTNFIRFGIGASGTNIANVTVVCDSPRAVPGEFTQPAYFASTTTAAYHAPRFDYSPTNIGEPRGLLVEGQAQNALFYSQDVTQASRWTIQAFGSGSYTTVSTTGGTAPDNTNTANLLTEGTGSFSRSIYQAVSMAIGTHTASLFVKAGSGNARYIRLVLASAAGNFVYVTVNLANGAVTQTAAAVGTATAASAIVTPYTGGWYRISLTGTFTAATNFCFIVPSDSATPAVNAGDYGRYDYVGTTASFSVWGCQVEAGSGASSYIPTGASQVTRNADSCVMTGSNFSSWFNNTEGTCLFVGDNLFVPAASNFATNWALISAANSQRIHQYTRHTTGRAGASARNPSGTALTFDSPFGGTTEITTTAVYKTAFALKTDDFAYSINGQTVGLGDASNGVFETVTSIEFARDAIRNGHIKQFKFYPTRLSNAQLQTLTAP